MRKVMILLGGTMLLSCSKVDTQTLSTENVNVEEVITTAQQDIATQQDTTIYFNSDDIFTTPYIEDPIKYFRENNKYKDWDNNDQKRTLIGFVSEKDGGTSYLKIMRSSGIEKLDNEALRLIKELKYEKPATNNDNVPIRAGNMVIFVLFPPQ